MTDECKKPSSAEIINDALIKSKIDVTAGLIMCDGLLLIAQRKHGKSLEYKWEFPGVSWSRAKLWKSALDAK